MAVRTGSEIAAPTMGSVQNAHRRSRSSNIWRLSARQPLCLAESFPEKSASFQERRQPPRLGASEKFRYSAIIPKCAPVSLIGAVRQQERPHELGEPPSNRGIPRNRGQGATQSRSLSLIASPSARRVKQKLNSAGLPGGVSQHSGDPKNSVIRRFGGLKPSRVHRRERRRPRSAGYERGSRRRVTAATDNRQ